MAFVIVSGGHLTGSHMRTLRARPLLLVAGLGVLLLMAACVALGYRLAQLATPATAAQPLDLEQPETRVLVDRVGALAGRLVQLESETAALAKRLGVAPVAATLASDPRSAAAGGPLLPAAGLSQLESDFLRLEGTLADLADVAAEREVELMAYPSRMPVAGNAV